jgi:hypothetical protein
MSFALEADCASSAPVGSPHWSYAEAGALLGLAMQPA